jgi:polyphosphate:AMP phosphotransferase
MFEALEIGRRVGRKKFSAAELPLRQQLLQLQFELEDKSYPVIVIVAGVEGAGKGSVVHKFNEWMDPRGIETHAFWDRSDEEDERPFYWRFWRAMPAKGRIGVFFGSWYTQPIINRAFGTGSDAELDAEMQRIDDFERMLSDDGVLIVKLWFHLSAKTAHARYDEEARQKLDELNIPEVDTQFTERYEEFKRISERAIRQTDTDHSPWHLIEAENDNYRDLTAGETLLTSLQQRFLKDDISAPAASALQLPPSGNQPTILSTIATDKVLKPASYKKQLAKYQSRLQDLSWQMRLQGRSVVAVFEGWDAAGKGSALRRVTQAVDPRLFHLVQFAAPTDEERAHHYLWRFWRQLARDGKATFFDRSWYGRVLVERVEGFAREEEWQRAYLEINRFEEQICAHGSVVLKFWVHISKEEQLARFKQRQETPHKQHKITGEDWRNREKWDEYEAAVHDMVAHTSTSYAPWTLVAGNDKRYARIQILKVFCKQLEAALA